MKHRHVFPVLVILLMTAAYIHPLWSQQPSPPVQRAFHYQGCLTDASGTKINGNRDVQFEILDTDTSPMTVLFSETVLGLQIENGIFEHAIGTVDTTGNPLPPLIFQKRVALRLTVDGETLSPVIPIFPSPVALVALYADSLKQPLPPGPPGPAGPPGANGINCWDTNGNGMNDPAEDTNGDGVWDATDCIGPPGLRGPAGAPGAPGANGINCWDTNGNGMNDAAEDTNGDGVWDANDCRGKDGKDGKDGAGGSDTLIVKRLVVTGESYHEGNEHFRRGITVGGADSARSALRIDSTGEIYARSLHIIDPTVTGLHDQNRIVEFDSTGSVHRLPERYISINPQDPSKSDTTVVTGSGIRTPVLDVINPETGKPIVRFDSSGSYHFVREHYITPSFYDPTRMDTTTIDGSGVIAPSISINDPVTGNPVAAIEPDGEGYFRSLHVLDSLGFPMINFNRDGTSEHFYPEYYYGGFFVPLENGNILKIDPLEGFTIKNPNSPTNPWVAHIDPNGNSLFTGQKNAIVNTSSYGVRKMYVEEATELWFNDRGFGRLKNGEVRIELDPVFLETTSIDDAHPIHVRITPTADCNGLYVAEKGDDYFIVRELMQGSSNATFDWEVNAKRRHYEDARLEVYDGTTSRIPREVK